MKKLLLLSTLLAFALHAGSVEFNEADSITKRTMPSHGNTILSFNDAIKNATDSIVFVATKHNSKKRVLTQINPFFEQFFGEQFSRRFQEQNIPPLQALGSGVIISKDGYIVTNYHVVKDADEIIVTINGSAKELTAEVIGTDAKSDLAVIKVDADDLKPITMGSSKNLKVGDVVFAIGNPFGVGQTVTQGIISAQHKNSMGINEYENFIQTDASINPGNSGGALVDSRGVLIGINSAIISRSGGNNGIGFAIEVDMVKNIAKKLIEKGSIDRGYMGVSIGDLTKDLKALYKHKKGAMIVAVEPDTPAEKAGLKRGDLIISVDSKNIESAASLKNTIGLKEPGSTIDITYERDKNLLDTTITLTSLAQTVHESSDLLNGMELLSLTDSLRYRYSIPSGVEGVLIVRIKEGSKAAMQGIQEGDIIIQIENSEIKNMNDLRAALKKYAKRYKRIYINRRGQILVVALR